MSPYTHCYFDSYQSRNTEGKLAIGGYLPLDMVYNFEPVPDALNKEQAARILGAQGNVWTEYITHEERLNEMIFPRMCALSEALWSPIEKKDYNNFTFRLISQFKFLYYHKINYSAALFDIFSKASTDTTGILKLELYSKYPRGKIYYTVNGIEPDIHADLYSGKISVDQSVGLRAVLFEDNQKRGNTFSKRFYVSRATGKNIVLANAPHPEYSAGGAASLVDGTTGDLPWIPSEWLGFKGSNLDATIDLGTLQNISRVTVDALQEEAGKIYLPNEVNVLYSENGTDYKKAATLDSSAIQSMNRKLILRFPVKQARWVKVVAKNSHEKDWLFVDEILVE
jgi:hexosaminidase